VQAKLLRVLQERDLERVGGNRTLKVDVRVIATTNRNLEQCVERKEFRQDLFFRLNVVPIHIPPLRERKEDIPELSEQFMHRFARKHGVRVKGLSDTCLAVLLEHHWPGNVRELQNVLERAVILCGDGGLLEPEHLGFAPAAHVVVAESLPISACSSGTGASSPGSVAVEPLPTGGIMPLAELEKRQIFAALAHTQGNRTHAARLLGISIRTLRNKLHEYNGEFSGNPQSAVVAG
jgi:transcriptional regulator with PAS, ATPase and Fis domain